MKAPGKNASVLIILLCSLLWSTAGILIKQIPWNSFVISFSRAIPACAVALLGMRLLKLRFVFDRSTVLGGAMLGLVAVAFMAANKLTTAANAIVLQYTAPVFMLLYLALFRRQRMKRRDVAAVTLTICGIALFFFDRLGAGSLLGNCVAVLSGVFFAGMYLFLGGGEDMSRRMSSVVIGHSISALICLPFVFIYPPELTVTSVGCVLLLGVFQLGLPYVLFAYASNSCPPLMNLLLSYLEPLLNPVWVLLFDGEAPGLFALVGGVIVIFTVSVWCVLDSRKPKETVPAK